MDIEQLEILFIDHKPVLHSYERKDLLDYIVDNYAPLQVYQQLNGETYNYETLKTYQDLYEFTDIHAGTVFPILSLKDKKDEELDFFILTSLYYIYELKSDCFYAEKMICSLKEYLKRNKIEYDFDERV